MSCLPKTRSASRWHGSRRSGIWLTGLLAATAIAAAAQQPLTLAAQELEPGTYQTAPSGMNVAFGGYGFSTGNVLFDAALPVHGATARVQAVSLGYLRTLNVFGRSAKFDVQVPVSWARFAGDVQGEFRTRTPRGLADPRVRLSVNLVGSPALSLAEFAKYRQRTIVGASVQVTMPLGQYDRTRLINLGANRWGFRPEVAVSHARGRWIVEGAAGAWLFTDNGDYFGSTTLSQAPFYFGKGSVIYTVRRSLWLSASYGRGVGGETRVGTLERHDLQRNDRVGATVSIPAGRQGALRVVATSGLTTRLGTDFDSITIGYQRTWGPARPRRQ